MPVIRKVKSKIALPALKKEDAPRVQRKEVTLEGSNGELGQEVHRAKKVCFFCKNKVNPVHWDVNTLRKSVNDRGRISNRTRTGACAKHQRQVSREIKRARILALLSFSSRI